MSNILKFKKADDIESVMAECEKYREQLIQYCLRYFGCEREYAEDCVQDAYVALYENLRKGIDIRNYKSWLYSVTLNYKNKVLKEKIKCNEYEFADNEEKENILANALTYEPDYENSIITDETIKECAVKIISELTSDERKLYELRYYKGKQFKEIADVLGISYTAVRKRHEKLRGKIIEKIIRYEDL